MTTSQRLGPLLGRGVVVAALRDVVWARDHRLITLVGAPGVGKTRIALEVAETIAREGDLANGVRVVDLAALTDAGLVLPAIAAACDVELADTGGVHQLIAALRDHDMLVVLDNCEHVLAAGAAVADLVAGAPKLSVLATSRVALGLRGEWRIDVEPLDDRTAAELFAQRAREAGGGKRIVENGAAAAMAAICRELDNLPLAIELAAARARVLGIAQILDRLPQRMQLLADGPVDAPARQRSMRATIAWSYDTLGDASRLLLRSLCLLPGSFTVETAEAVGGEATLSSLRVLLDQQFVRHDGDGYRIPEIVRQYCAEVQDDDERDIVMAALVTSTTRFVQDADAHLEGPQQGVWAERLERELDIVRAVLVWSIDRDPDAALRLATAMARFWNQHGHLVEGARWLDRALEATPRETSFERARALGAVGLLLEIGGELEAAEFRLLAALDVFTALGDTAAVVDTTLDLANVELDRGALDAATRLFDDCLAAARTAGDERREVKATFGLATAAYYRGDLDTAARDWERALRFFERHDDAVRIAVLLGNLGAVATARGEIDRSVGLFRRALGVQRRIGDRTGIALTLTNLGEALLAAGEVEPAEHALRESLQLCEELRLSRCSVEALTHLARVAEIHGRGDEALELVQRALAEGVRVDARHALLGVLERAASLAVAVRQPESAARLLGARLGLRRALDAAETADRPSIDELTGRVEGLLGATDLEAEVSAGTTLALGSVGELVGQLVRRRQPTLAAVVPAPPRQLPLGLTQREVEVLGYLVQRYTDREIATTLYISVRTVTTHVARILTKLGVDGRRQAAAEATRLGLVAS